MIWWCSVCGREETLATSRCPACQVAMESVDVEWLGDDDGDVVFELELLPGERTALLQELFSANVAHRWMKDIELVVRDEDAETVDRLLDLILGEDTRVDDGDDGDEESSDSFADTTTSLSPAAAGVAVDAAMSGNEHQPSGGGGLGVADYSEFEDVPSDSGGYESLSALFVAVDALSNAGLDAEDEVQQFLEVSGDILMITPPFGVEEEDWADIQSTTRNLATALHGDPDHDPDHDVTLSELGSFRARLQKLV